MKQARQQSWGNTSVTIRLGEELRGRQDGDAVPGMEDEKVVVATHNHLGMGDPSERKNEVVSCVATTWLNFIDVRLLNGKEQAPPSNQIDEFGTGSHWDQPCEAASRYNFFELREPFCANTELI